MRFVESNQLTDFDIADAVTVSEAEARFIIEIFDDPFDPAAGHRLRAGLNQSDTPRFCPYFMHMHAPIAEIEGDIGAVRKIVREKLFDDMAFVTEAQDEIGYAMSGVDFHDVPEDRPLTDFHHRLGNAVGLLT